MSYWSHNPELLDEITVEALPDEWRNKIDAGEIELLDVPEEIRDQAMLKGEKDYWAMRMDDAKMQMKGRRLLEADVKEEKDEEAFIDPL
jgi:hypothetical protein